MKFSEVSTGFYGNPQPRHVIHVDANPHNLGQVMQADVCVHADAGLFLGRLLACADRLRRPADATLVSPHPPAQGATRTARSAASRRGKCGVDPMALIARPAAATARGRACCSWT